MKRFAWIVAVAVLVATPLAWGQGRSDENVVRLFNGQDLSGWKLFIPDENVDPATVWQVQDGVIHCTGDPAGYIRTTEEHENYLLRFDWRWPEAGGNSGLLMHISGEDMVWPKSIEAQLMSENAGDFFIIEGTDFKERVNKDDRRVAKKESSSEKPLGEWNTIRARVVGDAITIWVNGVLQNTATETTVTKGYIGLQSEGTPIEFRNITLRPIDPDRARRPERGERGERGMRGEGGQRGERPERGEGRRRAVEE